MSLAYQEYHRDATRAPPRQHWVGAWRIDYLAFARPDRCQRPPLLVIGGAFQNFTSYKYCVERMVQDGPVVLVDLPSLGNNDQLSPELGMEDLADLLHRFVQDAGWERVHLMGLSLGSAIASTFACKYPAATARLIVAGIVVRPRKSWRMLVEESVRVLQEGQMDAFSQAVVLYLVNHQRLRETGMSPTARRLFCRQMRHLNENERQRYQINGRRLLSVEGLIGHPACETLVTTGEFDSFTLPWENAAFADRCPQGRLVLIEGADHLPQLQKREQSLDLFAAFLRGDPLDALSGIRRLPAGQAEDALERRRDLRRRPLHAVGRLCGPPRGAGLAEVALPVEVVDIDFFGCLLRPALPGALAVAEHARDLTLELADPALRLPLLVFGYEEDGRLRCLFRHGDIGLAEQFAAALRDPQQFLPVAAGPRQPVSRLYG